MKTVSKKKQVPLSEIVTIPPKSYPSTNIEHDDITMIENYLPSASALDIVDRFSAGLRGAKSGRILSITGPYGSGKSTMASFLSGLVSPKNSKEWRSAHNILKKEPENYSRTLVYARKKASIHKTGMIKCLVTARSEPISVTLLRAINNGVTNFTNSKFLLKRMHQHMRDLKKNIVPDATKMIELIEEIAETSPIMIIIDEFGKNIEYFATDESQQSDLFLLQELAERSGKGHRIPLSIVTLQHMAFEEYAVGTSTTQKQEWAKIQGRFEDIPFANSPDQTRLLISNTIKLGDSQEHCRNVHIWAKKESKSMQDLGVGTGSDSNLIASCYPLSPIALEVLPELCARYGQYERTLLSFISDSRKHTVATFIDENYWKPSSPPVMGLDTLYDYFISGTSMIHSSSQNVSRLMEVETIIRDAHGLDKTEKKTLKTIGILNLIGRSGYLRASRRMIDYAVGADSRQALDRLEKKSIITYRRHADEYRIWHGTDIDIAAKLDMYRKKYQRSSLSVLLRNVIQMEPVVASKHSIETGTMRLFDRRFVLKSEDDMNENYDGLILYRVDKSTVPSYKRPVIVVTAGDTTELKFAAIEVTAIRDILDSDDTVTADWVAKKEIEERLVDAEIILNRVFADVYGGSARWSYKDTAIPRGTPSTITSKVCDMAYPKTPIIRNEVINRTVLSAQGSSAKRSLLEAMIKRAEEPKFGIKGYGPDRAIYEALFINNGIHALSRSSLWKLQDPKNEKMLSVWNAMLGVIKRSDGRKTLTDIYNVAKMLPYGIKDGPIQLIVIAMMLTHRNNIALYEHGTFVPKVQPEIAERMTKNPGYFELKYFRPSSAKKTLLEQIVADLKIKSGGSILDVVGYLARTISALPPHVRTTKKLDKNTIAVRDTILHAIEPDTLLFESLPNALGYGSRMSQNDAKKFSKKLAKSMDVLQSGFTKIFEDMRDLLFATTGIDDRKKLSKVAKVVESSVTDNRMKVFLRAVSADTLERESDWINYVAMSLTDVPPTDWKDDQREMFESKLQSMSLTFKRLASIHFADISYSFVKPSYQMTVTHADGTEHHNIVSLKPIQQKKIESVIKEIKKVMKKQGLAKKDMGSIIAMLISKETDAL